MNRYKIKYDYNTTLKNKDVDDMYKTHEVLPESHRIYKFLAGDPKNDYAEGIVVNMNDKAYVSKNTSLSEMYVMSEWFSKKNNK